MLDTSLWCWTLPFDATLSLDAGLFPLMLDSFLDTGLFFQCWTFSSMLDTLLWCWTLCFDAGLFPFVQCSTHLFFDAGHFFIQCSFCLKMDSFLFKAGLFLFEAALFSFKASSHYCCNSFASSPCHHDSFAGSSSLSLWLICWGKNSAFLVLSL